jgi:lauroyl/myristoyl acyltransferase
VTDGAGTLRDVLRFDGSGWRRFAELGSVYGPDWFTRVMPPLVAAIIFAIGREPRAGVLRNQRVVRGRRSWLAERWNAYRVFAGLARSMTDGMQLWGPRPPAMDLAVRDPEIFDDAYAEGRGVVVVTGHFGSWEVGARALGARGRPVTMVTAQERNPSVRAFVHEMRTRHGTGVVYSDRSYLGGLGILRALRRGEVVGMQIEPWGPLAGSHPVDFCGVRTRFQLGPFEAARIAHAPLVPIFTIRRGHRRYELLVTGRFDPATRADAVQALEATARLYEELVRRYSRQWLMFRDAWPASPGPDAS